MRWEEYGWQFCRITDIITNATPCSHAPRVQKFQLPHYLGRRRQQGASKKLSVENYRHGSDACYELMGNLISLNPCGVSGLSTRPLITPPYRPWLLSAMPYVALPLSGVIIVYCNYSYNYL